jgi:hypothetical protein
LDRTKQPGEAELFVLLARSANRVAVTVQGVGNVLDWLAAMGRQESSCAADLKPSGGLPSSHPFQCWHILGSNFHAQ